MLTSNCGYDSTQDDALLHGVPPASRFAGLPSTNRVSMLELTHAGVQCTSYLVVSATGLCHTAPDAQYATGEYSAGGICVILFIAQ